MLDELPAIALLYPDVSASVCWLTVYCSSMRHYRQLPTIKEPNFIFISDISILTVLEASHILRLVLDLTFCRCAGEVVSYDTIDGLLVLLVKP